VLPEHADVALALWVLNTWIFESFDIAPYLSITSPTRRCGKTVLMTLLYWLCRRGEKSDKKSKDAISPPAENGEPTPGPAEVRWGTGRTSAKASYAVGSSATVLLRSARAKAWRSQPACSRRSVPRRLA